ncbi:MAG: phytanoyl-CoA dioxygenase family protein [Rhodospirillaceae bacterium]|nr:phytanoyl-CoA dioxygenase family protein [Rhodospirillaceae bacterium]MBT6137252.1 phytanoyl-CoA dioxygenase family protein [Rhodospirillaceae bacterium]
MKTEKILAHAPKVLNQEQRQSYFDKGYLVLDRFIDANWLERIWTVTNKMIDDSRAYTQSDSKFDLEDGHTAEAPRLRRLTQQVVHDPLYWELAASSPITDLAEDLLGPDVVFHHSKLNFKWAGGGEEVKWHQDIPFYPHTNYSVLAIGLYLNDVDDEMGPMGAVPGSHKGEIFNHYDSEDRWVGALDDRDVPRAGTERTEWFRGKAGTVTVHHCRTVHGSMPNLSNRSRPLLLNIFSAADAMPCTANPAPCEKVGAIVRGSRARWIDFDSEPCLAPPDWSGGYTSIFALQQKEGEGVEAAE